MAAPPIALPGERLAKVIARSGLCSRRDAEEWIKGGRVSVNGTLVRTPAFNVSESDKIKVDGQPLTARKGTRLWLYHKPPGLVVTEKDPEGRPTIFEKLAAEGLPRVLTVGRLDINTEGLLLLTNDGGLKRVLELPATGWLRRYRVRAFGSITQAQLDVLKDGIEVEGVQYGAIEAVLERQQGANVWLVVALREGKNREVKNVLGVLGLTVNRLIRVSYGPFQLGDLPIGGIEVVKARVLKEQLGKKLADEAGVDFDSDLPEPAALVQRKRAADPGQRIGAPERAGPRPRPRAAHDEDRPIRHRPGRPDSGPPRKPKREAPVSEERPRRILFDDGREETFTPKPKREKPGDKPAGIFGDRPPRAAGGKFGDRPPRPAGARSGDRPPRSGSKFEDRPPRSGAGKFGDRPPRRDADAPRPARSPRRDGASPRPPRGDGDSPRPPRRDGGAPRPRGAAAGSDRKPYADRDRARPLGAGRPSRGARPAAAPSRGPRPGGNRPPRKPRP